MGPKQDSVIPRYGNFPDYYRFNPSENRLAVFQSDDGRKALQEMTFPRPIEPGPSDAQPFLVLDIGCNSGELTRQFQALLQSVVFEGSHGGQAVSRQVKVLAVDKDPILVERARESSRQCSSPGDDQCFMPVDIMDQLATDTLISSYLARHDRSKFDLISCFSVLMWIHLNHEDEGLETVVDFLCSRTRHFLVELQPWKCYQTAARRMRRAGSEEFPLMSRLGSKRIKNPPDVEAFVLDKVRPHFDEELFLGKSDTWKRRIHLFSSTARNVTCPP